MFKTNALKLRQSLGSILSRLEKNGEPILVERDRKPVAVLISLEQYKKRFVDFEADQTRNEIVKRIREQEIAMPAGESVIDMIRGMRS